MENNFAHLQMFIERIVKDTVETVMNRTDQDNTKVQQDLPTQNDATEILNADQAAEFLHLAKQTLYTMTCKRKIPFYKNGKKILFKKNELQEWMDSGRKSQQEDLNQEQHSNRSRRTR